MFYALIYINNHIITCIDCMLSMIQWLERLLIISSLNLAMLHVISSNL